MTTPFAFVPRVISKYANSKPWEGISRPSRSPSPDAATDECDDEDSDVSEFTSTTVPSAVGKGKGKEKVVESAQSKQATIAQDIASLISLALSDYNIWCDADLRWKLDACLTDGASPDGAGFVPINYLLRRPPFRGSLSLASGPSETEAVRALRTHAAHLEVRIRLPSSTSSSVWYGTGKTSRKKDVGGYEVRRKDWVTLGDRPSRGWTRRRWDDLTVYVECIPPPYRTIGRIARFVEMLLFPLSELDASPCTNVQCVTLPPHYLDKPGDTPKCKGYALIALSTKAHVEAILGAWPWKRHPVLSPTHGDQHGEGDKGKDQISDASPIAKEAHKYGFRATTKARWDALNEEYLLYKQRIVDEMARSQSDVHHPIEDHAHEGEPVANTPQTQTQTTPSSAYPFDCLVFVRNVHPETNKTTLRNLFGQAFQDERLGQGLDYVDFTKGMDTCYLRLASPHHATRLIAFFEEQQKAQMDGLDVAGRVPLGGGKLIAMERIQGKKEELYWDKVPEKVRRQAVDKAVRASTPGSAAEPSVSTPSHTDGAHGCGHRKRKREF